MKKLFFILLVFIGLSLGAQNPFGWNDGSYPLTSYQIKPAENSWYISGDLIYSAFKVDTSFYASGAKWSTSSVGFGMAFKNDNSISIKNGFVIDEPVYWGVWRESSVLQLNLKSSYTADYITYAVFELDSISLDVKDNPYYSLDPVWPTITELKVKKPVTTKALTMAQFMAYKPLMPKYASLDRPEVSETAAVIRVGKYFNSCTIRFGEADVRKGYLLMKIYATPLQNSKSTETFKTYKIYW